VLGRLLIDNGGIIRGKYETLIGHERPPNVNSYYNKKKLHNGDVKSLPKFRPGTMKPMATKCRGETY